MVKNLTANDLYVAYCVSDVDWKTYCKAPNENTWRNYQESKKKENEIRQALDEAGIAYEG